MPTIEVDTSKPVCLTLNPDNTFKTSVAVACAVRLFEHEKKGSTITSISFSDSVGAPDAFSALTVRIGYSASTDLFGELYLLFRVIVYVSGDKLVVTQL